MHDSNGRRGVRLSNTNTTSSDATVHSGTKLKRCASLPAQKQQNIAFAKDLKTQRESSVESLGKLRIKSFKLKKSVLRMISVCLNWKIADVRVIQ